MHRLLSMSAGLLTAVAFTSCIYDAEVADNGDGDGDTYIRLSLTPQEPTSRAAEDDPHAGTDAESKFHSLRVWAFNGDSGSDGDMPLSYKEDEAPSGTVTMPIPRKSGGAEYKTLDLYILANGESGSTLAGTANNKVKTRGELKAATISGRFSVNADKSAQATAVPETGLPMSRAVTAIAVDDFKSENPVPDKSIKVNLHRAVSKLSFYFARKANAGVDRAYITGVTINGGSIAAKEKVFTAEERFSGNMATAATSASLPADAGTLGEIIYGKTAAGSVATLASGADPKEYLKRTDEDAAAYLERLTGAGMSAKYTTYLNEAAGSVTGTIRYRLFDTDNERSVSFTIPSGKFLRNYEVVIYAYFVGGELIVQPMVMPWNVIDSAIGGNPAFSFSALKDEEAKSCFVINPRTDDKGDIEADKSSHADYAFKLTAPDGAIWKAVIYDEDETEDGWGALKKNADGSPKASEDLVFSYGKHGNVNRVSHGRARKDAYYISFYAKNALVKYVEGTQDDGQNHNDYIFTDLTEYGNEFFNPDYTKKKRLPTARLYVQMSTDGGLTWNNLDINPVNTKGKFKAKDGKKRLFPGENDFIWIRQLPTEYNKKNKSEDPSDYSRVDYGDMIDNSHVDDINDKKEEVRTDAEKRWWRVNPYLSKSKK